MTDVVWVTTGYPWESREGLPTVLVEQSIGLPVIASPIGGIPDLLALGRGSLLASPSAAHIEEALRAFCANWASAAAAAIRLRAHVEADHEAATNAARLADAYAAIGASRPHPTCADSPRAA